MGGRAIQSLGNVGRQIENYVRNFDVSSAQNRNDGDSGGKCGGNGGNRLDILFRRNIAVGNFLDDLRHFIRQLLNGGIIHFVGEIDNNIESLPSTLQTIFTNRSGNVKKCSQYSRTNYRWYEFN